MLRPPPFWAPMACMRLVTPVMAERYRLVPVPIPVPVPALPDPLCRRDDGVCSIGIWLGRFGRGEGLEVLILGLLRGVGGRQSLSWSCSCSWSRRTRPGVRSFDDIPLPPLLSPEYRFGGGREVEAEVIDSWIVRISPCSDRVRPVVGRRGGGASFSFPSPTPTTSPPSKRVVVVVGGRGGVARAQSWFAACSMFARRVTSGSRRRLKREKYTIHFARGYISFL
jgi:hypothetical protein